MREKLGPTTSVCSTESDASSNRVEKHLSPRSLPGSSTTKLLETEFDDADDSEGSQSVAARSFSPGFSARDSISSSASSYNESFSVPVSRTAALDIKDSDDGASPNFSIRRHTSQQHWAPENQLPDVPSSVSTHLPNLQSEPKGFASLKPTSFNIGYVNPLQREMEQSTMALISPKVLKELLADSLGRHRFRDHLVGTGSDVKALDTWCDLRAYKAMTDIVKTTAVALHELISTSGSSVALSLEDQEEVLSSLRQGSMVGDSLEQPQQTLLNHLFHNQFQKYIQYKLTENASVRLGQIGLTESEKSGLGEAFCLTNPRLRDHPIVLVSRGFEILTGYRAKAIVGRNCRMLAGPATNPATSRRISVALNIGEGITTIVLNYRASGEPFWNLLSIIPLRDTTGEVVYFIGGQTEVSGTLAKGRHLSFLLGTEEDARAPAKAPFEDISPTLRRMSESIVSHGRPDMAASRRASDGFTMPFGPSSTAKVEGNRGRTWGSTSSGSMSPPEQKGMKGFFASVGGAKRRDSTLSNSKQRFLAAEALIDEESRPLALQISAFSEVYSKIVIFCRSNREIMFCSPDFLKFCGLPSSSPFDCFCSSLLHIDVLALVSDSTNRKEIKEAVAEGKPLSLAVQISYKNKNKPQEAISPRPSVLHLTALVDKDDNVEAYVAIFG